VALLLDDMAGIATFTLVPSIPVLGPPNSGWLSVKASLRLLSRLAAPYLDLDDRPRRRDNARNRCTLSPMNDCLQIFKKFSSHSSKVQ